ncbi:MAG: flagellar export protein FliJ [Gammaproteobacteria bacterium]|nr:flagellar export protein FliJ [Gammaproteobacteria bacterium]MDE2250895.1 flagellar export protein FliJ [Gammaproteobacteria bacterium]
MKRAQRLRPLHELADQNERQCALRLADCQQRIAAGDQRYQELVRYRLEYQQLFHARASSGAPMRGLREQQVFIARLAEAVRAQRALVDQLRAESAQLQEEWRSAATRRQAVGKVIEHARAEEIMKQEKRQQRELDELATQARVRR